MVEQAESGGFFGCLDDVVRGYGQWLSVKEQGHLAAFQKRLQNDPEAARAEAAMFALLRSKQLDPHPAEDPGRGGVDFVCGPAAKPVLVEVTIAQADAVVKKTGLPKKIGEDEQARAFSQITDLLKARAAKKAKQIGHPLAATIVAICLEHEWSDLLMGSLAARWLMTGEPKISVPLGDGAPQETKQVTHLRESAFFRFAPNGSVEPCRRNISAILLGGLSASQTHVIGLLHPEPLVPLDYKPFFPIPFLVVENWPLRSGDQPVLKWRLPEVDPNPVSFLHQPPRLSERELRGDH